MVLLLLEMQHDGLLVARVFFGLWLFPLDWLVFTSRMFPRVLGVLAPVMIGADVGMVAYLLVMGVRTAPPSVPAGAVSTLTGTSSPAPAQR
jgi:Domain of unknown function (DUF4386)